MEDNYGFIRWAKLTVYKGDNGVVKPRLTMDINAGKTAQGLFRIIRVGFEAPDGDFNKLTPSGVKKIAVDMDAFIGLTKTMIRPDGPTQFFRYDEEAGKYVDADYETATRASQKIRINARVKLDGLDDNLRQAQKRVGKDQYEPIPDAPCTVKIGDEEFPGIRESYTLVREGKLEVSHLGTFKAKSDNVMVLS